MTVHLVCIGSSEPSVYLSNIAYVMTVHLVCIGSSEPSMYLSSKAYAVTIHSVCIGSSEPSVYLSSIAYVVTVHLVCIGSSEPSLFTRALNTKLAYAVSAYAGLVLSARVNREGSDDSACEFNHKLGLVNCVY